MKQYIYSLENTETKKRYVGITNNPKRRKYRHFSDLRANRHDSKKLQRSFDKYGEEKFVFTILLEKECERNVILSLEKEYIQKYDSYENGYNMNKGGLENNGFSSKFSREDVFEILSVYEFTKSRIIHGTLEEIFSASRTNFYRMRKGLSHLQYKEEYNLLPKKNRKEIYENFYNINKIKDKVYKFSSGNGKASFRRTLDDVSVFMILSLYEFEDKITVPNMKKIADKLSISIQPLKTIKENGVAYMETIERYNNLDLEQKKSVYNESKLHFNLQ